VSEVPVLDRLRQARMARGESCENLSKRTGVRIEWIRAIEAGQFHELPPGIYGRSAIRAQANALGLNAREVLEACATLVQHVEDPIAAMRRLNGIVTSEPARSVAEKSATALPDWRLIAASVIDAGAMAFTLLVVITSTVAMGLPISSLDRSAGGPLFLVTFVLTACYFVFFGGIIGRTAGECLTGMQPPSPEPARLDLRAVALRTRQSIFRDSHFIEMLGEWIGRRTVGSWQSIVAHAQNK
jgi:hypothetical protein